MRAVVCDLTEDGRYSVSTCSGVTQDAQPPNIYVREGDTFAEAIEALTMNFTKDSLVFSHVEDLIISEKAARNGIASVLDYVARSEDMRLSTDLFVIQGDSTDFLIAAAGERTSASDMLLAMKKDIKQLSEGKVTSCGFASAELARNGVTLISAIKLTDNTSPTEDVDKVISPAGYAVIKDGKLLDFADREAAKGVNIIKGSAKTSAYTVQDENGEMVTLLMTRAKTKIEPEFQDGELIKINISTDVEANVGEVGSQTDISSEKVRGELEQKLSATIEDQLKEAINRSRELDADFMNIGETIKIEHPIKFSGCAERWDEVFRAAEISTEVSVVIERSYKLENPAEVDGRRVRNA